MPVEKWITVKQRNVKNSKLKNSKAELTKVQQYKLKKAKEKRRKQIRALAIIALISIVLITLAAISLTCADTEFKEESYIICEGDTLWKLYSEHVSGVRWDAWLHKMLTVNELGNDPVLITGDEIILLTAE